MPDEGTHHLPRVAQAPLRVPAVRTHVHQVRSRAARAPAGHAPLPPSPRRARARRRRTRRGRPRGAHDALPGRTRPQGLCRAGARRGRWLSPAAAPVARRGDSTGADASSRRSSQISTRGASSTSWRGAAAAASRATCARFARTSGARSRSSRPIPTRPTARLSVRSCLGRASSVTTSTWCAAPTQLRRDQAERRRETGRRRPKGARRSGHGARWRPDLFHARHRLLEARERLSERERRRLLFEREPVLAEAWALKEAPSGDLPGAGPHRCRAPTRLLPAPGRLRAASSLHGLRRRPRSLALAAARLLRRAHHERLRRACHQQGQGDQAPGLRAADLRRLARARSPSMRLTGSRSAPPLDRREPSFRPLQMGPVFRRRLHLSAVFTSRVPRSGSFSGTSACTDISDCATSVAGN
jgi:hypothetical protein